MNFHLEHKNRAFGHMPMAAYLKGVRRKPLHFESALPPCLIHCNRYRI